MLCEFFKLLGDAKYFLGEGYLFALVTYKTFVYSVLLNKNGQFYIFLKQTTLI